MIENPAMIEKGVSDASRPRNGPARWRVCLALFLAVGLALAAAGRFCLRQARHWDGTVGTDMISLYDARFEEGRAVLAGVARGAYITSFPGEKRTATAARTQYALAPVLLVEGDAGATVMVRDDPPDALVAPESGWVLLRDLGNGARIFRKAGE